MRRRDFVALVGAGAAWPFALRAQQSERKWKIGFLGAASATKYASLVDALRAGLRDLGYIEHQNLDIEFRWAQGNNQRLPALAAELAALNLDCLVTHGTPGTAAAKKASPTLPIVMAVSGDAVATGLIGSLAKPGGNVTGTTFFGPELAAKRLELLREAVPGASHLGVLVNPNNPVNGPVLKAMDSAAASLHLKLQQFIVHRSSDLDGAFAQIAAQKLDGVAIFEDAVTVANPAPIAQLAAARHLPLTGFAEIAKAGGLLGYGVDLPALFRRAAYFVDRIFHGAKPADIPVEQPAKFETVVNLTAAKALGITLPPALLAIADEVIG